MRMTIDDKITSALKESTLARLKLKSPVMVDAGTEVAVAIEKMNQTDYGYVLVMENGILIGIFTERDILMKMASISDTDGKSIDEFMTRDPVTLRIDSTIAKAVYEMSAHGYRHLPVLDKNGEKCVGMVAAKNIVKFVADFLPDQVYNLPPTPNQQMLTPEGG
ncbi:MAG: CBS domain-containing protein [Candidatus Marinimicrobia bacterium]|nr:CBS domain-containing protein [Candidatus Neomarinimicrobiota bacterium]